MTWVDYFAFIFFALSGIILLQRKKFLLLLLTIQIYINDFAPMYSDYWNIWLIKTEYLNDLREYSFSVLFIILNVSIFGRYIRLLICKTRTWNITPEAIQNNSFNNFFRLTFFYLITSFVGYNYFNSSLWYLLFLHVFFALLYKNTKNYLFRAALALPMLFHFYGAYQRSIIIPIIILALYLAKDKIHIVRFIILSLVTYILFGVALAGRAYVDNNFNLIDIIFNPQFASTIIANLSNIAAGTVVFEMKEVVADSAIVDYFICAISPLPSSMLTSCNFSLMSVSEYLKLSNIGIPAPAFYMFSFLGVAAYFYWFLLTIFLYNIEITEFDIQFNPIVNGLIYVSALISIIYIYHSEIRVSLTFLFFSLCLAACRKSYSLIAGNKIMNF